MLTTLIKIIVWIFLTWLQASMNLQKNLELHIFHNYQDDAKDIKCLLEWGRKHESMFPIIDF